jgi:outer membrane protein TolC
MSKQMKANFLLLLLFITASFTTTAQTRYELTVQQAVELAYKNVVDLKNAQLDYKIQEAQNKEITGRALPQISASGGTQYYLKVPQVLFPQSDVNVYNVLKAQNLIPATTQAPTPVLVPFSFQQPWNLSLGATLQQLLFQPDVFVGLQARKTALNLSASAIDQTKEAIKDSAYRRYYAILIAEKQLGFLNESVVRLERLYHDDSVMFKNGFAEQLDVDRVQVQLTNLRTSQSVFNNSISLAYAAMKFALGISQKDTVVLKEELTNETVKENVLDAGFKYDDRAEIRTLGFNRQLQELDVKRNQLAALPTVALAGNYTVNALGPKFFTDPATSWLKSSYVGLSVAVPLFDGNQRRYRVKQSQLNVEKVDNAIDKVKQVIDLQQTISKQSLTNALLNLDAQQRNMTLAESVYNTTKKKFEAGIGTSFEILQAENELQTAQSNYFTGLYNAIIAKIAYQSSLGKLQ